MRFQPLFLTPFAAAAFALAGPTLEFAPPAGTKVEKTVTTVTKVRSTEVKFLVDGEEPEGAPEAPELTFDSTDEFVFVDEFVKSADGRPTRLERTYQDLTTKTVQGMGGDESRQNEIEKKSELASKVVVFEWDAKKDQYKRSFKDGEGDDALLENLDCDLEFLAFLPGKAVKEGDEWELDGSKAGIILFPGGDLCMKSTDDDSDDPQMDEALRQNLAGKITLKHGGTKEEGDVELVVIELKGDLSTKGESETEKRGKVSLDMAYEVSGEILWDAKHNHLHSVKIEGTDKTHYSTHAELEFNDEKHSLEQRFTFEGTVTFELKTSE